MSESTLEVPLKNRSRRINHANLPVFCFYGGWRNKTHHKYVYCIQKVHDNRITEIFILQIPKKRWNSNSLFNKGYNESSIIQIHISQFAQYEVEEIDRNIVFPRSVSVFKNVKHLAICLIYIVLFNKILLYNALYNVY